MQNKKILIVDKLNKYFVKSGKLVKVLDDVSFDVNEGDFLGIIGESGSGKSTTGKCIIRLYSSSSGNIIFDNNIINQQKISRKTKNWLYKNMSMIFQDPMSSLNSRKNVLSLISEPLVINRVIQKEAMSLINDCYKFNSFFRNTYQWQDYNLTKEYIIPFYKQNIEFIKKGIEGFQQLENVASNLEELKNIMLTVEANIKSTLKNYSEYVRLIKGIITYNGEKFKNNELDELEIKYCNAFENFNKEKLHLQAPKEYWILNDKLNQLKDDLDNYIIERKIKLYDRPQSRLKSIKAQYNSQIKSYKQNALLTDSITKNILDKINVMILKDSLKAISLIDSDLYVEEKSIEEFEKVLNSKIKSKYNSLIIQLAELNKVSDKLDNMSTSNVNEQEIKSALTEYEYLFKKNNANYKILKEFDFIKNDSSIKRMIDNLNNESRRNKHFMKKHINIEEEKISFIEKEMVKLKKEFKKQSKKDHEKLDVAKKELEKAKIEKEKYFADSNIEFNKKNKILIKEQNMEISKLKKELYEKQMELKKIIFSKFKIMSDLVKNDKFKKSDINILKKDLKIKWATIDAINFEIDTYDSDVNLYRQLRATSYLKLLSLYNQLKTSITRSYVYNALEEVGLKSEHAYRYPHEFSGGQRQRIVIARSLIRKPKLIIADEPISALDVSIQAQVINIMKDLANKYGITFLFIAHDLSMVRYTSNRLIILHKGKIVEKGDTNEVFNNPIHPYTKSLIKASPEFSKIHVDLASFGSKLDYDKNYSDSNQPKFFSVNDDVEHYVFATEEQFNRWTKKK